MSLRLSGQNQLSYLGVTPLQPPDLVYVHRNPISGPVANADFRNFNVGTFWLNPDNQTLWILVRKPDSNPLWIQLGITAAGFLQTLTGDNPIAVFPLGLNINIIGDPNITTVGSNITHSVQVTLNPSITVTNLTVTGLTTVNNFTATGTLITNLSQGVVQSPGAGLPLFSSEGANGQVLISGGPGFQPVWANITPGAGINIVNGAGTITISATGGGGGTITSVLTKNATPQFNLVGTVETVDFQPPNGNLVLGDSLVSRTTGTDNVGLGQAVLHDLTSGQLNTAIGFQSLNSITTGNNNTMVGWDSGIDITSGSNNTGIGTGALGAIFTGNNNIALGNGAGLAYTTNESNNIVIGNTGTIGDSAVIRIGTFGTHTSAFVQGITSVIPGSSIVTVAANGQLGITGAAPLLTLTGNLGTAVPTAGGTINIVDANSTVRFVATGPNTLTQNFGLSNLILGNGAASIAAAANNVGMGLGVFNVLANGTQNVAIGAQSLNTVSNGSRNTGLGYHTLNQISTQNDNTAIGNNALSTSIGSNNTAVGSGALASVSMGSNNIAIGLNAGSSYVGAEANNILVGNAGTAAESNTTRIGTAQTSAYMAGVYGASVGPTNAQVIIDNTGKLGTSAVGVGAGLVFIQKQVVNNVAEVVFNVPSIYNDYFLMWHNVVVVPAVSPGIGFLRIQVSFDGGATFQASPYTTQQNPPWNGINIATDGVSAFGPEYNCGTSFLFNLTSGAGYVQAGGQDNFLQPASPSMVQNPEVGAYLTTNVVVNAFRIKYFQGAANQFTGTITGTFKLYALVG